MTMNPGSDKVRCAACGADEIYHRNTGANGGYGPRLLQGLGGFLRPATMDVYLCAACGYLQFHADKESRKKVTGTVHWHRTK